jgi:hypothetical protein
MSRSSRNWIAYLCENLASSGMMPTWEAATYLTDNLFGDKPNPRLLRTACPYEDVSLTGKSAVLVVYFPGHNQPHQLLLLDAAKAWDLVFENSDEFNTWAEERYHWIKTALISVTAGVPVSPTLPSTLEAVKN